MGICAVCVSYGASSFSTLLAQSQLDYHRCEVSSFFPSPSHRLSPPKCARLLTAAFLLRQRASKVSASVRHPSSSSRSPFSPYFWQAACDDRR
ncbi:hypothetical protein K466DRAFT_580813 [Polyporus arcularius HHB13444]|uniref:Uncharacterized protein n=1 Tax=Polyporus arcularius HHB13444 TaxID=1314778 RepID=A0A5C3PUW5_9APHY|nr:hypothetical protein K466DRAFT_580813 [Polyporus arcularius HHB13444]